MTLAELLRANSSEYELLAEWHGERAPLDEQHLAACQAMLAVAITLREWLRPSTSIEGTTQARTEAPRHPSFPPDCKAKVGRVQSRWRLVQPASI